jgi:hypothetical protein
MTNHMHFVAVPDRADSLAVLFCRANGCYAQAVGDGGRDGGQPDAPHSMGQNGVSL